MLVVTVFVTLVVTIYRLGMDYRFFCFSHSVVFLNCDLFIHSLFCFVQNVFFILLFTIQSFNFV